MILLSQLARDALRVHRDRQAFHPKQVGSEWKDLDLVIFLVYSVVRLTPHGHDKRSMLRWRLLDSIA